MSKKLKRILAFVLSLVLIGTSVYFGRSWADDIENTITFTFRQDGDDPISNLNVDLLKTNTSTNSAEKVSSATTNSSGVATFNNVANGIYLLSPDLTKYELPDEGYNEAEYRAYGNASGFVVQVQNGAVVSKSHQDFILFRKTASLVVNKITSTVNYPSASPIPDTKFVLQDEEGNDVSDVVSTDSSGRAVFSNVIPGSYKLVEVEPHKGFVKAQPKDIVVQLDKTNEVTIENLHYVNCTVTKLETGTNKALSGVEFTLYLGDKEVETKTTDSNGKVTFENLYKHSDAQYKVYETKALPGYSVAKDAVVTFDGSKGVNTTVYNDKVKVVINKVDEKSKEPVSGAEISIYKSNEKKEQLDLVYSFTSSTTGEDITDKLEYGNYYLVKETKAPEGYVLNENTELLPWFVEKDGEYLYTSQFTIENKKEEPRYKVLIQKVNENGKPLQGATLSVYYVDEKGNIGDVVEGLESINSVAFETQLENGKYAVVEVSAPEGYTKSEPVYFEVNSKETEVMVTDKQTKVYIEKLASDTNEVLPGATLQIIDKDGKVVKQLTTTSTKLEVKGLAVGKYTLHETKAPKDYQIANDVEFEISDNDAHNGDTVVMIDQPEDEEIVVKNLIKVSKVDKETKKVLHGSHITIYQYYETPYENLQYQTVTEEGQYEASFDIELAEPADWYIEGDKGTVVPLADFTIEDDKDIYDIEGLNNGTYVIVEDEAPVGYYLDSKPVVVTFDKEVSQLEKVVFENTPTKVEFAKVDSKTKLPVEGATLAVYDGDKLIDRWVTDEDTHIISGLEIGKSYTLKEESAPADYNKGADLTFTVEDMLEASSMVQYIEYENVKKPSVYSVNILKVDEQSNVLQGATLSLYQKTEMVRSNKLIETWTSTDTAKHIENLEPGTYIIKEVKAPAGFATITDIEFTITENGQLLSNGSLINAKNKTFNLNVVDKTTKVLIKKVEGSIDSVIPAVGAVLKVTDENGKEIITYTVTEDEPVLALSGLEVGKTYTVTEIDAPGYYTIAQPVTFTVRDVTTEQIITMVNELRDVEYELIVDKKDPNGDFVEGAVLSLSMGPMPIETWTTGKEAKKIEHLAPGTYTITEVEAPKGYRRMNSYTFTLDRDQQRVEIGSNEFVTEKEIHLIDEFDEVKINKLDSQTKQQLAGAEFEIYSINDVYFIYSSAGTGSTDEDDEAVISENAKPVYKFTTTDKPTILRGELTPGDYVMLETKAPNGYKIGSPTYFSVYSDRNTEVTVLNDKKEIPSFRVEIIKMDIGKKTLEGATLKLFRLVGNEEIPVEDQWTTTQTGRYFTLEPGEYIVKEIKAPDGYLYAGNADYAVKFTIGDDEDTKDSSNVISSQTGKEVYITDDKTDVTINKVDTEGVLLDGAKLAIYDGEVKIDEWVSSSATGHNINGVLVAGKTYTLKEIEAPAGYEVSNPVEFTVPKFDKTFTVNFTNKKTQIKTYDVEISKQDITTSTEIPGATLKIEKITGDTTYTQDDWTWVSNGTVHTITGLTPGKYRLTETLAPSSQGYVKASDVEFTLNEDGSSSNKVVMYDDYTRLHIKKVDINGNFVEGAILELLDSNGEVYKTWTSGKDAEEFLRIPVGKYTLVETKAPEGYEIAQPMEINVYPISKVQEYRMIDNKDVKSHSINISKQDITTKKELKDAQLTVTYKNGWRTTVLDSWTSTDTAHKLTNVLEDVVYTLTETKAPNGYVEAESIAFFVKTEDGKQVIYVGKTTDAKENFKVNTSNDTVTMYDDYTKVEIHKVDSKDKLLKGAKLEIVNSDGKVVASFTTGEKAQAVHKLAVGKYTLKEVEAPEGYAIAEPVSFEVKKTGDVQIVKMTDVLLTKTTVYDVTISKQDITNGKELPGATLIVKNKDGKEIDKWVSTDKPHIIKDLPYGEYSLTEITAPDGYVKAETIYFTLNKDGKSNSKIVMKDDVTKVDISKKDSNTKSFLSGAVLELYNEKGEKIDSWTSTESVKSLTNLKHGKYTLKEVTAPNGYNLAKDITFEVTDKPEKITVEMYDEKVTVITPRTENPHTEEQLQTKETVQTGDSNNIAMFAIIMVILLMAIPVAIILFKKKDDEK